MESLILLKKPKDWSCLPISKIVSTPVSDGPHETPEFLEWGVPFLSVNNIVDNQLSFDDLRYISNKDHARFSLKCKPQFHDILFGKAASVGKVAIVETDIEFNIWSPLALIRVDTCINPHFIYYSLQSLYVLEQIKRLTNTSSQGNLGMGLIGDLIVLIPPKYEQEAIAEILAEVDRSIQETTHIIRKLKDIMYGLNLDLMNQHRQPGQVWVQATIAEIIDPLRKLTYGIVQPGPRQKESGVPIIRGQDYSSGEVSTEDLYLVLPSIAAAYQRSTVKGGDLLLSIVGYVGQTAQVPDELTGANLTQTTARIAIKEGLSSRFFLHYFQSPDFIEEIRRYTKGSAQPGLNLSDIENFVVHYPEYEVQLEIAQVLDDLDQQIKNEENNCSKLNAIKQGLMEDLLIGKVRIPGLDALDSEEL